MLSLSIAIIAIVVVVVVVVVVVLLLVFVIMFVLLVIVAPAIKQKLLIAGRGYRCTIALAENKPTTNISKDFGFDN